MHKAEIEIMEEVMSAAESGAITLAAGHPDIIDEVKSEVALRWKKRAAGGNPPTDAKAWAYICGKHYAMRILKDGARHVELSEIIADTLTECTEESTIIQRIEPKPLGWLDAQEAIEALNKLIAITTRIIMKKADETDRLIVELHYKRHWTFAKIAGEIGISEECGRRRWSRLMWSIIDDIMAEVRSDKSLAAIFAHILEDRDDFRASILGLFSIISAKGLPALESMLSSILPAS
jgi:DNA-directed RNA polymerase specialized sigma24 family protein